MDFGLVGSSIEGLVQPDQVVLEGKPKCSINGSGLSAKQERSDPFDDDGRASKMLKKDDLSLRSDDTNNNGLPKHQMLSFSSSANNNSNNNKASAHEVTFLTGKDLGLIADKNGQTFYLHPSSAYTKSSSGFGSGNMNGSMHGSLTGIRGPFTPAQWIELEHQAMIYKYLTANVPVPTHLLIPIRKALYSSGFPGFSVGSYPASYAWGSFHLGFHGSTDPEPGRCRRTDGKKWRCSRDAVPDQKYCERHINRGRHRSRKPVEGHTGQAASGPTNSTKVVPAMSAPLTSLVTSGGASNSVTIAQHQMKGLQPNGVTNASIDSAVNRLNDQQGLLGMHQNINMNSKDSSFSMSKQQMSLDESSQSEFGLVSTDSLLNPSQKGSYVDCKIYNSYLGFSSQQTQDRGSLRHLSDDWPKEQSNRSANPWPEQLKSDWTQLSMSIPLSSTFSSSMSSPNHERALSPLRLSRELDSSEMGLGVGAVVGETTKQNTWIPVAWGNPMGGPLGEVLNNASNATGGCSTAALNLKGEGWDGSPQLGSSPTGVLQKSTFVSLSNSSSAGSPRGENRMTQEGARSCNGILGAAAQC